MSDSYIALVEKSIDERAQQYQELLRLRADLAAVTAERDALAARLAPVDDEALVEIARQAILKETDECVGIWPTILVVVIAAIRPHIEAAERERCAKIIEPYGPRPCDSCVFCEPCWCGETLKEEKARQWDEYTDLAAAIRSGSVK